MGDVWKRSDREMPEEDERRCVVMWVPRARGDWAVPFEVCTAADLWMLRRSGKTLYWQPLRPPDDVAPDLARRLLERSGD